MSGASRGDRVVCFAFHSLRNMTCRCLDGIRVVPRDGPVVELHEGVLSFWSPPRLPKMLPDVTGQGFKHLCRGVL